MEILRASNMGLHNGAEIQRRAAGIADKLDIAERKPVAEHTPEDAMRRLQRLLQGKKIGDGEYEVVG